MSRHSLLVCLVLLVSFVATARADTWSETHRFSNSDSAAIKVFEPDGYVASVTIDGQARTDTVPAVLQIPDKDAFVVVTFTAPSGAKWSKKIETKKSRVTEVFVKHEAAAPGAAPTTKHAYIGTMNWDAKSCGGVEGTKPKVEFRDEADAIVKAHQFRGSAPVDFELAEGTYSVRLYKSEDDGSTSYKSTTSTKITHDGWKATVDCKGKGKGYQLTFE